MLFNSIIFVFVKIIWLYFFYSLKWQLIQLNNYEIVVVEYDCTNKIKLKHKDTILW